MKKIVISLVFIYQESIDQIMTMVPTDEIVIILVFINQESIDQIMTMVPTDEEKTKLQV